MEIGFIFIGTLSLATISTRFIPFLFEKQIKKKMKKRLINDLLVAALMLFLVLRSYNYFNSYNELVYQLIAGAIVVVTYLSLNNFILSIFVSTLIYTYLLNR